MRGSISIGLDVGGTAVKAAAIDADGVVIARAVSDRYSRADRSTLSRAVRAAADGLGVDPRGASAIGLCLPGLVNAAGDGIEYAANVPGLSGLRFCDLVADAFGTPAGSIPVVPTTDAIAAASDIAAVEALRGRLLAISLGTGVGAAVLDDGRPLIVTGRSCGHLGQIDVSLDDAPPVGPDGGAGGLEAYMGLPALIARYGSGGESGGEEILQFIGPDDPPVRALARAIRIGHAMYRPDHVRLLGGVGIRLAGLSGALRKHVEGGLTALARPSWTLGFGRDDWHAAVGAARLASGHSTNTR